MKAVLQRVSAAQVDISGETVGKIGRGFLVLLGVAQGDTEEDLDRLLAKILRLRVFEDGNGKMNRSVQDVGGGLLVVSQFTLLANYRHGNRPDFLGAAAPAEAAVSGTGGGDGSGTARAVRCGYAGQPVQ